MKRRILMSLVLVATCLATFLLTVSVGQAKTPSAVAFEAPVTAPEPPPAEIPIAPPRPTPPLPISPRPSLPRPTPPVAPASVQPTLSTACALQPERKKSRITPRSVQRLNPADFTLARFRQSASEANKGRVLETGYTPVERVTLIDPSNFGDRYLRDLNGNPALLDPIVVLHETVGSASSAINMFSTYHPDDDDQASYHSLIGLDGTIFYLVPPDKRAFGAGNSVFVGSRGAEAVRTNPTLPASVNNFAYHISLETPYDGNHNGYTHSGYTQAQYQSLAWLVAKTGVPNDRLTTHKAVDRSRSRMDPRSFNDDRFFKLLSAYPRTAEIAIRCTEAT